MGKIGYSKPEHSSRKHKLVANGPAYEISDPANKLLHTLGTFMNEPTYYQGDTKNSNGVTSQAQEVIYTAHKLAQDSPEDLLVIAAWARDKINGLKLRTTPQVLFAVAAYNKKTRPYLERYATQVMSRADDIRTAFASYAALFTTKGEKRTLPTSFKRSLAKALSSQSVYSLVKYNSDNHPTFRDVIAMVKGKKTYQVVKDGKQGWPLPKSLYEYLAFGKVSDDSPEIVQLRSKFFQNKDLSKVTLEDVEKAGLTWENVVSHYGSTLEVWRLCLPVMGEMALTRNLRNFEQANFTDNDWKVIEESLLGKKTVQLPFRFLAAYNNVTTGRAKSLVARLFDQSIETVPELPGKSVVFTDNSGSMNQSVSEGSSMTLRDVGNSLGAILKKRNADSVDIYVFGTDLKKVEVNTVDSGITLLENIRTVGYTVGEGTDVDNVEREINKYRDNNIKVDRFVILSDMCCYSMSNNSKTGSLQRAFDEYRRKVNKDCFLYSVNLAGYAQAQVKPNDNHVIIMSGWSEQIFKLMLDAEGRSSNSEKSLPTMEELRLRYRVGDKIL